MTAKDNQYRRLEFELDELKMTSMRWWYAKVMVKEQLQKVHRKYEMKIEYNTEHHEKEIARLENYLSTLEKQKKGVLITTEVDEKILDSEEKLRDEKQKLADAIAKNEMFLADATVTESKYIKNGTMLLFSVPDQFIHFVLERKDRLSQYLLTLTYVTNDEDEPEVKKPTTKKPGGLKGRAEFKAGKKKVAKKPAPKKGAKGGRGRSKKVK